VWVVPPISGSATPVFHQVINRCSFSNFYKQCQSQKSVINEFVSFLLLLSRICALKTQLNFGTFDTGSAAKAVQKKKKKKKKEMDES